MKLPCASKTGKARARIQRTGTAWPDDAVFHLGLNPLDASPKKVDDLSAIVRAARLAAARQTARIAALLQRMLPPSES